jgi:hypothetical protein
MRRSETALNFARGTNHDLTDFSTLFEGFFGFGGSPGRSGDYASLPARFAGTTAPAAITSLLPAPSVTTDKDDYAPGETATITASGFDVGATVTFEVDHVDGPGDDGVYGTADDETVDLGGDGHDPWTVTDGGAGDLDGVANGTIVTEWHVNPDDSLDERFLVTASDGEAMATNTFTDTHSPGNPDVDLADSPNEGFVNGAFFTNDAQGAGTGVINSFVRISTNQPTEQGYNTSDRKLEFDENSSPNFTRDLLFADIPVVTLEDGFQYLEFQLDINEPNTGSSNYLSLDEIEIYFSENQIVAGTYDGVSFGGTATKVYELDAGGDHWIALDYGLQAGSGVSDMIMYVPLSSFAGVEDDDFITLYSEFGLQPTASSEGITFDWSNNSGFEEWAVRKFILKSGVKYEDMNADGVRDEDGVDNILGNADDEAGLAGWTIYIDANGNDTLDWTDAGGMNGVWDAGEGEQWVETGADGSYQFSLFDDGTYTFREVLKDGWFQSAPAEGEFTESLKLGDRSLNNDFGNYQLATKSGVKFHDLNADGVMNGADAGIENWTIWAYHDDNGDGLLQAGEQTDGVSTTTNASGVYSFSLDPGKYIIVEDSVTGWIQSFPGNDVVDDGTGVEDGGYAITLTSGQVDSGNDFGNYQQATKSGTKFHDLNADGVRDADGIDNIAGSAPTASATRSTCRP